jgi:hypothetical protein
MRRGVAVAVMLAAVALAAAPAAASAATSGVTSAQAAAIAARLPLVRSLERTHPGAFSQVTSPVAGQWQVAFYSRDQEFVQVIVSAADGSVLGQYTGLQIAWTMARGHAGAFGHHLDALYVWLPLSLLFVAPFLDWRRPWRMINLDLLALSFFSVSFAFFNHGDIHRSVPLSYPPLVYLLARLLWLARPGGRRPVPPLRLNFGVRWLAAGLVLLVAFRIVLNIVDSNVIDVGYASVVGARRVLDGGALYGQFPASISHGDTYGPFSYEAYVPFVKLWGFSGPPVSLAAAKAAAIFFDLACIVLLFALGVRLRGPATGVVLAYAWAAYPFTALALESGSNDALVAALVLATLLVARWPFPRGAFTALAGLSKLAPLALVPLMATEGLRERGARGVAWFAAGLLAVGALAMAPALAHDTLATIYDRTISYQANRSAPFSVWGLYGGLGAAQTAVAVLAIALAGALAVLPRRPDLVGLSACSAAVLIAVQLGASYWFYLYIPWFFAPAAVALFGRPEQFLDRFTLRRGRIASPEAQRREALVRLAGAPR